MRLTINLFLVVIILSSIACKKQQSTPSDIQFPDTPTVVSIPFDSSYSVEGIGDIEIAPYSNKNMMIDIKKHGIIEREVTVSFHNLPENTTVTWGAYNKGYPPFTTSIEFYTYDLPLGIYPAIIKTHTDDYPAKEYTFNLKVGFYSTIDCHRFFFNSHNYSSIKTKTLNNQVMNITPKLNPVSAEDRLYFGNVLLSHNYGDTYLSKSGYTNPSEISNRHVYFSIDCNKGTITVPAQKLFGQGKSQKVFDVHGNGTLDINNKKFSITYYTSFTDSGMVNNETYIIEGELF